MNVRAEVKVEVEAEVKVEVEVEIEVEIEDFVLNTANLNPFTLNPLLNVACHSKKLIEGKLV